MREGILERFGLTKNEVKVYLTLLKIGSALAGDITKKSGIHRRNVYDSIERLIEKGLVRYIVQNNRRYFRAADPKNFLSILKQQKRELRRKEAMFNEILPELSLTKEMAVDKQQAYFYRGSEGLKSVYEDILRTNKNFVGFGPGEHIDKILKYFFIYFIGERRRRKLKAKLIYSEKARMVKKNHSSLSKVRYLADKYTSFAAHRIYGTKVAILHLTEQEPFAIVIDNKDIADGYRKYFDLLWKTAKE